MVVIGGMEVTKIKELNYGHLNNPKTAHNEICFENSDVIVPILKFCEMRPWKIMVWMGIF